MNSKSRIGQSTYRPNVQDILQSPSKTTGSYRIILRSDNVHYELCDVGGGRAERKKWPFVSDHPKALIFQVDITGYCHSLAEDEDANCMQESCWLFKSICEGFSFADTHHVLLLFSKLDLLERTLATNRVDDFFPDFIGSQTDVEAVKLFFP